MAAIGGLMEPLTYKMAIQDPIYNLGSIWVMEYADSVPILHRDLLGAGSNYIQAVLLTFPADILLRAYASIIQVLDLPFIFILPPLGVDFPAGRGFLPGAFRPAQFSARFWRRPGCCNPDIDCHQKPAYCAFLRLPDCSS